MRRSNSAPPKSRGSREETEKKEAKAWKATGTEGFSMLSFSIRYGACIGVLLRLVDLAKGNGDRTNG